MGLSHISRTIFNFKVTFFMGFALDSCNNITSSLTAYEKLVRYCKRLLRKMNFNFNFLSFSLFFFNIYERNSLPR